MSDFFTNAPLGYVMCYLIEMELAGSLGAGDLELLFWNGWSSWCLFELGVEAAAGDDRPPRGDGVKLLRDADDMLKSTEPNGILFGVRTKAGNSGFRSSGDYG